MQKHFSGGVNGEHAGGNLTATNFVHSAPGRPQTTAGTFNGRGQSQKSKRSYLICRCEHQLGRPHPPPEAAVAANQRLRARRLLEREPACADHHWVPSGHARDLADEQHQGGHEHLSPHLHQQLHSQRRTPLRRPPPHPVEGWPEAPGLWQLKCNAPRKPGLEQQLAK